MGTVYDSDQISTIKTYAGKVIPTNWMLCDGRQLNRIDYSQLADAMGVPAAQATFFIPDLRNKFIYGASDPAVQLATGGEVNHTLTNAEMPYHSHGGATSGRDRSQNHQHTPDGGGYFAQYLGGGGVIYYNGTGEARPGSSVTGFTDPADHLHYIGADGGSAAHNNMPPYIVLAYIIKVAGTSINAGGALVGPMGPPGVLSDPGYRWMGSTAPLAAGPAAGTAWTYNVAGAPYLDLTPGKWRVAASSMVYGNTPDYVYMSIWNETDGFYYPESLGDGHYVNGATAPYAQVRCGTIINVTKNIRVRLRVHPNGGSIQTIPAAGNAPVARMEAWIEGPGPKGDTGAAGGALNPPPAWITPPLTSGSHYGAPYGPVQYRKWDDIGLVEVRGLWQPAAGSSDIFTLPVGARPTGGYVLIFSGTNSSYTGTDLRVYSTGFIQQQVGAPVGGWVSLSQIRFFVN
jgi:microcystin-dependent protein